MTSMRLVVDIGNTNVHAALCSDAGILREDRFVHRSRGDLGSFFERFTRRWRAEISEVGVASVQPRSLEAFRSWASGLRVPLHTVGEDLPVPLRHAYRDPSQLGVDRLVDAYSARRRVPGDHIVINLGTAITVDAVTASGEFHSGAILPGLWLGLQSLADGTARLPSIERLDDAVSFPTRSTEEAMAFGMVVGLAGMIDRVARTLAAAVGIPERAVATGGDARRIAPYSHVIEAIVPGLTLLGILDLLRGASESPADP